MPKYRMIHVDHYMSRPVAPFDDLKSEISGRPTSKVPVIRVFGVDGDGLKICIHVHGFYPYVAIQNREPDNNELPSRIVSDIENSLGKLVGHQRQQPTNNPRDKEQQPPAAGITTGPTVVLEEDTESRDLSTRLLRERTPLTFLGPDQKVPIHRIESIKSYNYYGYHNKSEDFFKLHLYNPRMVKQLAQLFEDCHVLGRFIPVFWAHLPYILLFFIDNNLRGMQFIEVDQLYWRKDKEPRDTSTRPMSPSGSYENTQNQIRSGMVGFENAEFITDIDPISSCELEADIRYEWILNKQRFGSKGNDDALRELWLDDQEATQATSLVDPKLPLYNLERSYIEQLCECYEIDPTKLDLELAEKPNLSQLRPKNEPNFADSDDSFDIILQDREDNPIDSATPEDIHPPVLMPPSSSGNLVVEKQVSEEEDEFSDDEEFLRNLPKVIESIKTKSWSEEARPKQEPGTSNPSINIKNETTFLDKIKIEPSEYKSQLVAQSEIELLKIKRENTDMISGGTIKDEEFSDDDQLLMEAVMKAETQDPALNPHCSMQVTPQQQNKKRKFSDNSMIDGRSVICSTIDRVKASSQRSTSSSREIISHEYQNLCLMSMELHCSTREKLRPDPAFDPIEIAFYCIRNDAPETSSKTSQIIGMIITDPFGEDAGADNTATNQESMETHTPPPPPTSSSSLFSSYQIKSPSSLSTMSFVQKIRTLLHKTGLSMRDIELIVVDTEMELIMKLVDVVRSYDPEILLGYEMEQLSWGYLLERASILNMNISSGLSRVSDSNLSNNSKSVESNFVQPIMFTGRMVFSTWRIIRHEINLNTCSYERIHHHALGERIPCFSFETLTKWFNQNRNRWRVIDYYLIRVIGQMRILDRFDLMAKVSELARVYGTQFIDVITRGSQIGIESMMLRLAKLQNLTPLSPTVMQRNKMRAPEALPLVMEPETNIYYDPVVVLDFQSLYPSVVIAYNYCYSTCLGRVMDLESKQRHNFGCSQLHVEEEEIKRLLETNSITISPCGVAFVKKSVRHGILPKMLSELIITRAMVKDQMKKNMKSDRPNRRLQRILDHRQHGLKMMANTTYGYAGASYTGRMPCVEIADSIVSKGRETLENAIELVESRQEWNAKVIYGDTDSIFIQFKDCDRSIAFKRAYEMVDAITAANPYPIKMKFEKIYQPCVLQTKKRYCGFKYESPDQSRPEFEAKGIETIRRDCCPAAARMLEMALRIQFTTRDINDVKSYVQHQFVKIMSGKLSNIQDFIFARQYKPRDLDKVESVFVPAWQITKRLLAIDPRAEPRLSERVPFIITYGEPRTPLVNLAKTPIEVLENISYRINADYYIQKIICPTLNRVFCTMKVDTLLWYKSMPHQNLIHRSHYLIAQKNERYSTTSGAVASRTMSQYFSPSHCPICAKSIPMTEDVCGACRIDLTSSIVRLTEEVSRNQRKLFAHHLICRACSSLERSNVDNNCDQTDSSSSSSLDQHHNPCISYDCQNLFRYHQAKLDALNSNFLAQVLKSLN